MPERSSNAGECTTSGHDDRFRATLNARVRPAPRCRCRPAFDHDPAHVAIHHDARAALCGILQVGDADVPIVSARVIPYLQDARTARRAHRVNCDVRRS